VISGFSAEEDSDLTRIEEIPPSFITLTASAMTASSGRVTSSFSIRSSTQCLDEDKRQNIPSQAIFSNRSHIITELLKPIDYHAM
jgi:hypothetical protein